MEFQNELLSTHLAAMDVLLIHLLLNVAKHLCIPRQKTNKRKTILRVLAEVLSNVVKQMLENLPVTLPVVCDGIDNDPPSRPSTGLSISSIASDALSERRVIAARIFCTIFLPPSLFVTIK